jgi:hypothetical protein
MHARRLGPEVTALGLAGFADLQGKK